MSKKPIYVFFHICCINNWESVVNKLLNEIKSSGLYDKLTGIYCGVLGDKNNLSNPIFNDPKIEILYHSENMSYYERPTLYYLHENSRHFDFNVLYIHSKGIQHNGTNPCVEDWVDYLTYFNIHLHEECLSRLETHNVVGVNLQPNENSQSKQHYSGNFWWSKSSHIRTLNPNIGVKYTDPEYWITSNCNMFSALFNSNVNHYHERFLPEQYVCKPLLKLIK
jgi:hypothetical protein